MTLFSYYHTPSTFFPPLERHYHPDLSIWLSVDPMSDKYPGTSPYTYCANNPVRLVDPNGEEIYVSGDASNDVVVQLNNKTSGGFMVSIDENGKMSYEGKAKTRTDRFIKKAIDTKKETMHIIANNSTTFVGRDGKNYEYSRDDDGNLYSGGAYGGCIVSGKHSTSYQYVSPQNLSSLDSRVGDNISGGYMLHELAEGYYSAYQGHRMGSDGIGGNNYESAHGQANVISAGGWQPRTLPFRFIVERRHPIPRLPLLIEPQKTIIRYDRSAE